MGAFGISSDANDTSWDVLGHGYDEDKHGGETFPNTQERADEVAAYILAGFPGKNQVYFEQGCQTETVLGPTVYLLREGFKVPGKLVKAALEVARSARKSKRYLANWRDPQGREDALYEEIVMLKKALSDLGRIGL